MQPSAATSFEKLADPKGSAKCPLPVIKRLEDPIGSAIEKKARRQAEAIAKQKAKVEEEARAQAEKKQWGSDGKREDLKRSSLV